MRDSKGNARRWLRQAEFDLERASECLHDGVYSYAAFFAEQSAQKALKAYLLFRGKRYLTIHSVGELAKQAGALESGFLLLLDEAKRLDRHYLASRYPDALPEPAIPAESYVLAEAEEAVRTARAIVQRCQGLIAG